MSIAPVHVLAKPIEPDLQSGLQVLLLSGEGDALPTGFQMGHVPGSSGVAHPAIHCGKPTLLGVEYFQQMNLERVIHES